MPNTRPLASDPLRSFKYNVVIPHVLTNANQSGEARLGFMSFSGLGIAVEPLTYREGGDNLTTRKLPGQADFNPVTLSRGLFPTDWDNWFWMSNIFSAMYGGGVNPVVGAAPATDFRTVVYVNVLQHPNTTSQAAVNPYGVTFPNQANIVQVSHKLYSCWIGSLAYSDLDAGGNAVAVEQMTLNYEGFDTLWGGQFASGFVPNPTSW